jgi:Terminase-like family.
MKLYPQITHRKLVWRRWCIKNNCGGDPETFKQEYPSDDEEAFLVSGRPRFDREALTEYKNKCVAGTVGDLDNGFHINPDGFLEVWERPNRGKDYYIGVDVAKGLEEGDYSCGVVMDAGYNIAAMWHGHTDPDIFAAELEKLGNWYGEAMIAVEENNHGLTVINKLKDTYWNLYKRTTLNKATDEIREEIGWYSTEKSKQLAINHLAALVRKRELGLKSSKILSEMRTYVIEANGATNAQPGSHDDTVMATAIAAKVVEQYGGEFNMAIVDTDVKLPDTNGVFVEHQGEYVHRDMVPQDDDDGDWYRRAGW